MPQVITTPSVLLPGWLDRGAITLLAGASHAGKTTLLAQLVKAMATNTPFLGVRPARGTQVSYVLAGDAKPWQDTQDTFDTLGAPLDMSRVSYSLEFPIHNPHTATDLLISTLDALPPSDLYIIEGLIAFIAPVQVNNYHAPLQGLKALSSWAARKGVAILGTHHTGKQEGQKPRRPLDRVLGTTAFVGNLSHTMVLETPEELKSSDYRLTCYHRRLKTVAIFLTRDEETRGGPFRLVESGEEDRESWWEEIPCAPLSLHVKDLYRLAPAEGLAKRWIDELVQAGRLQGHGDGTYSRVLP